MRTCEQCGKEWEQGKPENICDCGGWIKPFAFVEGTGQLSSAPKGIITPVPKCLLCLDLGEVETLAGFINCPRQCPRPA